MWANKKKIEFIPRNSIRAFEMVTNGKFIKSGNDKK